MTPVDFLINQIKNDQTKKALTEKEWLKIFEQAKELEKSEKPINLEISDKEIEKAALDYYKSPIGNLDREIGFRYACKWYKEQITNSHTSEHSLQWKGETTKGNPQ